MNLKVRVIGIDPGLADTGYGITDFEKNRFTHICHGVIQTESTLELSERLKIIYDSLDTIIKKHKPDEASIEGIYFAKNVLSAIPVAHAKGVSHVLFAQHNIKVYEYSPLQIKQAIVGSGRAEKNQVQELVKLLLKLTELPKPNHAADALAIAMCHCNNRGFSITVSKQTGNR